MLGTASPLSVPSTTPSSATAFGRDFLRAHDLQIEYRNLTNPRHCPRGVYVVPRGLGVREWRGVVFVDEGYYRTGVFRFTIEIPLSYPDVAPSIVFPNHELLHPLIDPATGSLEIRNQFPSWHPRQHNICHLLHYVRSVFVNEAVMLHLIGKSAPDQGGIGAWIANKDALEMFANERDEFARNVTKIVARSQGIAEAPSEGDTIVFTPLNKAEKEQADALYKKYVRT